MIYCLKLKNNIYAVKIYIFVFLVIINYFHKL